MEKYSYLPKAEGTKDFIILGSKEEFAGLFIGAFAVMAVVAIIIAVIKNRK